MTFLMHAEILAIGDEIVSGQTLDTNSQWLSRRLEEFGVRTLYHTTVGDELAPGVAVFRQAVDRAEIVVATGGLGPTADDLTREALAQAVSRELALYPEALEHIRALFARRKREMPQRNKSQAMFPAGSRMIPNENGTAPGIDMEIPRAGRNPCRFFALPGVPAEMREMWDGYLRTEIAKLAGGAKKIVRRKINCFGAGESQIEAMLPDLIRRGRSPTVGITASNATISLRIDAEADTEADCLRLIDPTVQTIRDCLGDLVFGEGDDELQHAVVRLLNEKKQMLAVVEWGAGGLVTQWLSDAPDSENCFLSGMVYPNFQVFKRSHSFDPSSTEEKSHIEKFVIETGRILDADWLLLLGDMSDRNQNESMRVHLAMGNEDNFKMQTITQGIHPALRKIYTAKQALNLARRTILGQ
ncbi:MAG: CinA family nicotinamide mononucleotide deamidase-related protein [Pirellulales bacterium]|nr:CinA family nicotinamide mononucleotide deamidase-related protein [Pirellulales bacterium]